MGFAQIFIQSMLMLGLVIFLGSSIYINNYKMITLDSAVDDYVKLQKESSGSGIVCSNVVKYHLPTNTLNFTVTNIGSNSLQKDKLSFYVSSEHVQSYADNITVAIATDSNMINSLLWDAQEVVNVSLHKPLSSPLGTDITVIDEYSNRCQTNVTNLISASSCTEYLICGDCLSLVDGLTCVWDNNKQLCEAVVGGCNPSGPNCYSEAEGCPA